MKRSILRVVAVITIASAAALPSHAANTGAGASLLQAGGISMASYTVSGNQLVSQRNANLGISNTIGGTAVNGQATPEATFIASGSGSTCTYVPYFGCTVWYANIQTVSPTALSMDPLGNSATMTVTLIDTNNQTHAFNVRLTKPQYTQPVIPNLPYNPSLNVYFDPDTNVIGASAAGSQMLGLARGGYTVAGIVDGAPFVPAAPGCNFACNYIGANTFEAVGGSAGVVAP